jgi:hypothetical protein
LFFDKLLFPAEKDDLYSLDGKRETSIASYCLVKSWCLERLLLTTK